MDLNGDGAINLSVELAIVYLLASSAVLVALGVIWKKLVKPVFKGTRTLIKRTNMFFDDWYGDDLNPGVVARISSLESELEKVRHRVFHELDRNGGSSTKDAAFEALRTVREVQIQQEEEIQERKYLTAQLERILNTTFDHDTPK